MYTGKVTNYFTKKPMENVKVSDGLNITLTDSDGNFSLPEREDAHVINVGLLTECHGDWYINTDNHTGDFDFCVKPVTCGDNFSFMHMSDSEIEGRSKNDWIDFVRETVKQEKPLFFTNTGDLCRADGLARHYLLMNGESIGCPVRYTIGNHDMCQGDYGEQFYEKHYGPSWYSFDCGKIHFVFLNIGAGDFKSGYPKQLRMKWLENDLAKKDSDKAVIMLCHYFNPDPEGYGHTVDEIIKIAGDKGLKALIFGHDHYNYVYEYNNVLGICSSRPDSGGIDSTPAGSRKININGTEITCEYIYNIPISASEPDVYQWSSKLCGRVEFSSPIEENGSVWVCTSDDGYPSQCGIHKLCAKSGKLLSYIKTNSIKGNAAYCDGKLYAQDVTGVLYCVDTEKSEILWTAKTALPILYTRKGVLVAGNKVIAGSANRICAYDKDNGTFLWENSGGGCECPSEYSYDEKRGCIIISGQWYGIYAIELETGKTLWKSGDSVLLRFGTSSHLAEGDVIWKRGDNELGCIDASNGNVLKNTKSTARFDVCGRCASDGDVLYVPTSSYGVLGYDKNTLRHILTFPAYSARLFTAPYIHGNIGTVETTPKICGDKLIFASSDGYIHIYDKSNAFPIKHINAASPIIATPIITDSYIITADFSGNVKKFSL